MDGQTEYCQTDRKTDSNETDRQTNVTANVTQHSQPSQTESV